MQVCPSQRRGTAERSLSHINWGQIQSLSGLSSWGLPGHLPKATQRASPGSAGGAEPDLPAADGGGDRPGPSHGSVARHRGGEGAPGRSGLRCRKGPWERAVSAPGAGPGRGPTTNSSDRRAETPLPALAMKRPRAPSGSDGESDGAIDVGRESDLR